ncbi:hypothetical protein EVG20_g865 [Dentipellis fragilis]|uniref:Uncharacterized protein n=1 Tax=Dentipellis fragilis TaxID=205917 RepID=A0A4Y9ZC46_9AGAM|nr:hypothetical protein EVG20_g865 [Dentipellis fragilis]
MEHASRFLEGRISQDTGHYGSTTNLHDDAAPMAGSNSVESVPIARTTSAGVPVGTALGGEGAGVGDERAARPEVTGGDATAPAPPDAAAATPFYKKRWFIVSQIIAGAVGIGLLFVILYPVVGAIAQHVVDVSVLNIDTVSIMEPSNNSFTLGMNGLVTHTGIFSATISFPEPLNVSWVNGDEEVPLGYFGLQPLSAKNKRAYINQTTDFTVADQDAFGRFTQFMITSDKFTWRLTSNNLAARALRFPVSKGIKFRKDITLNGINNFDNNILLLDFQLPQDSPEGGIEFVALTQLTNPSPFALSLGTVVFNLGYRDIFLGAGIGTNTNIKPGPNNITLAGRLVPHNGSDSELSIVSDLFSRYLNGETSPVIAQGQSTLQSDNTSISWLSEGLQALKLTVPFRSFIPINPIRSIDIGYLALAFSEQNAWSPMANSQAVHASMELPFGFNLEIGEIQNAFNITKNGNVVAGLSTPLGASTSAIHVNDATNTSGNINITIENTALQVPDPIHPHFSQFNADLTDGNWTNFQLEGHSRAVANLSIGTLTLDPINFNVTSGLNGLQGLQNLVTIGGVDVIGGTSDGLTLGINVSIENPSDLQLGVGDLRLQMFQGGGLIGTTLMPNLTLNMGKNTPAVQGTFNPNNNDQGKQTLNNFIGKKGRLVAPVRKKHWAYILLLDVEVMIAGYGESSNVASLLAAFETLNISANLPALTSNLLAFASLEVLPTTGYENNISHVSVNLVNPFTADLDITDVQSTVSYRGIRLGDIQTATNFSSKGKGVTDSPALNLDLNMDPPSLFTVTRLLAVEAGLGTDQLDGIVQIGGYQYVDADSNTDAANSRRDNIYTGFNLPNFVDTAFKKLTSDVELTVGFSVGDFSTTLQYTQNDLPTKTDESLNLILPVLAKPIVQKIVSASALGVSQVIITNPQQTSFGTKLSGSITQSGPFDAVISFGNGLTVSWSDQPLGSIKMPDINIMGDVGAQFEIEATFDVADVGHLTDFTKVLLTEESFDWMISGDNLSVSALGISVFGISLPGKKVTLKGMNSLQNGVAINSFDLPANDPAGGIHLTLDTTVSNPSQVGVELSSIGFQNYFGFTNIGPATSNGSFTLQPQATVPLSLIGRLIPQDSESGLQDVSTIFNNFIHGMDSNVSVHGDSAGPSDVTWLNEGIKSLIVSAVLPNQGKLNIIKSISLDELDLRFSMDTAYDPSTSSNDASAAFTLPFNFPVDIKALEQNITVGTGGQSFAELIIPKGPSTTDVQQRVIHLTFSDVPFAVFGDQHSAFQEFLASTATSANQALQLSGAANTDADTGVGLLSLKDIEFSVGTSIAGLQGLNTRPTIIETLDVNHGFSDYLLIKVNSTLFNPSNITLAAGDVAFGLFFQDQEIGTADISNILILPGNDTYAIDVHYQPEGGAVSTGQQLLENYLQGVTSDTTIQGTQDTTPIDSLKLAMSEIRLSPVQIPALHQNLVPSAALLFPTDIVQTGIASSSFVLDNPFTASLNLLRVTATATHQNLNLGKIDNVDLSSSPVHADGHSDVTSQEIPFKFNLDPIMIIQLLLSGGQNNHVDLGPLPGLFQLVLQNPDFHPPINASVDTSQPTCVSGKQFDVDGAILNSLKNLQIELDVDSSVKIDDFPTDLAFKQFNVTAVTDNTALYLIGAVAPPIVQDMVNQAVLSFNAANITNLANDGFDLALRGSLTNTGPLDAEITFVEPVNVNWNGNDIAQIALPPICASANAGLPDYQTNAHLTITDQDQFTAFATYLLHNTDFNWTISTNALRVVALGTIFDGVSLSKSIGFKAFDNLPGVTISNFQLPSDDPAGGIHIETDSMIPSPAQLGIDLGTVTFQAFFNDVLVGPLSGDNLFLAPEATTKEHLSGRMIPQSGGNLDTIGTLFSDYLAGDNQTLSVHGDSVQPSGSAPVDWLSAAFKTLELQVILPGQKYTIIQSIAMSDLEVVMLTGDEAFAPLASSQNTIAEYKNPFGFSLQVVKSAEDITLAAQGADIAALKLPTSDNVGGVSTGNVVPLQITFESQTLQSLDNGAFAAFFAAVTDTQGIDFELKGSADVVARTTIGDVPISGIPFNVTTELKGINGFGGTADLSNISVTGSGGNGGNEYIKAPLTTKLQNPSNISLMTNDIALPVYYKGVMLGRAAIDSLDLVPGENTIQTEFHYEPADANDTTAQSFLSDFLQTNDALPLDIKGDSSSSPYGSLGPALSGVHLSTSLQALNVPPIITHINAFISLDSLVTNEIEINFDVANPLDTDMTIEFSQVDSGVNGETYAHFDQSFSGFTIPAHGTANSGTFGHVVLTQGALNSLGIIPLGELDVFSVSVVRMGDGGYEIPWLHITQLHVPTTYSLTLGLDAMKAALQSKTASQTNSSLPSSTLSSGSVASSRSPSAGPTSPDPASSATQPSGDQGTSAPHNEPSSSAPEPPAHSPAPAPSPSADESAAPKAEAPPASSSDSDAKPTDDSHGGNLPIPTSL